MAASGKLQVVEVLEDEEVAALDPVEQNRTVRGPWWDQFMQLKENAPKWCVIAKWTGGEENDEYRARWLRTRIVQRKAGAIPSGVYELRSRQAMIDGYVVGSQLFGRLIREHPDGKVEFVRGVRGNNGLRDGRYE